MFDRIAHGPGARKRAAIGTALLLAASLAACTPAPPPGPAAASLPAATTPAASGPEAPAASATPSPGATKAAADPADPSCPGDECIEIAVAGDILLHPALWAQAERDGKGKYDFGPLLAGIAPYLDQSDLALCNLETPVAAPNGPFGGYPMFNVPPQIIPALKKVGYDGCTTASNHSMDAGVAGVERTLDALEAAGMVSTGSYRSKAEAQKPLLVPAGSAKVAVIAGTYSLNGMKEDAPWRVDDIEQASLVARAKAARAAGADIVLAAIHDGAEYTSAPTASQLALYRSLAASGEFDFIYSHHTHSVLPLEKHQGTWIVYGLGNSVAKHATKTPLNKEGLTVKMQFVRTGDTWKPGDLVWAPHIMKPSPLRWCALPAKASAPCTTEAQDAASLKRTTDTVNSMDAKADGARMWTLGSR
ncbi:metallophosphatase [Arthrobacter sp. UCD-GKA]|uniref:CapA family protein n=1 Tax=Arthrobacter sp. UCD-GKA TaxID=1913576 RepID=UPI0008DE1BC3|nr:CapA family protein [Arthrobacter sp. UCD-GKA]OIH84323.1 metallophosphatase [Arthrobacter sp. UCD-GKA]